MAGQDQVAIVQELLKRRDSLAPDQQAIVSELAKRFNLTSGESVSMRLTSGGKEIPLAPDTPESPPEDKSIVGFGGNVLKSGGRLLGDIATAVTSPVQTAKAIGGLGVGLAEKLIPGEQPQEKYVSAFVQNYVDRYGGLENLKRTLYEDPVGVLADVATLAGGVGLAAKGVKFAAEAGNLGRVAATAGKVAKTAGAVSAVTDPVQIATKPLTAIPKALENSAMRNYRTVLLPTRKNAVQAAETTAAKMAENKIVALTQKGLRNKAQAGMAEWGPKAGTAFEKAAPVALEEATNAIESLKDKFLYVKGTKTVPTNRAGLQKFFEGAQDDLKALADPEGKIPAQILDNYIDDINSGLVGANQDYKLNLAPKTVAKMQQSTARAFRTILDTPNPTAAQINATYSMYAKMNQFLKEAYQASVTAKSGIVTGSSKGFGALIERLMPKPVREIPKSIAGVFDSVAWNTVAGATKQLIADALAKHDWPRANLLIKNVIKGATPISRVPAFAPDSSAQIVSK